MNIKLNENTKTKANKICTQFQKETGEDISVEDCIKLSMEVLSEEIDNFGIGRMFLRKYLWEKNVVFLNGSNKIIGSQ